MRTLATRLRNMEGYKQEREKLIQLGAMAAGLAQELNNPATAARRAAVDLRQSEKRFRTTHASLMKRSAPSSGISWSRPLRGRALRHIAAETQSLRQGDREEAIDAGSTRTRSRMLGSRPASASARVDEGELETVKRTVPAQDLENVIQWLAANLATPDLLKSISHSTERVSELVGAVKSYSFMDQAPWQEIDVHEGIRNALIILSSEPGDVTVTRDFHRTLPRASALTAASSTRCGRTSSIMQFTPSVGRVASMSARAATVSFFLLRLPITAVASRLRHSQTSFLCPYFTTKGGEADSAWLSATGSSSNGITEKSSFQHGSGWHTI